MKELWNLFRIFFRIGGFTFGGGYAMLPIIQREIVEKRKWATDEEVLDYYAIGQCTPGIIAVNTATFIGYKQKGILGGIAATAGVVFPSLIIITAIAAFFKHFQDYKIVNNAFSGIRAAVAALILSAVIKMWSKSIVDNLATIIFAFSFVIAAFTKISPILIVTTSATVGILLNYIKKGKK